MNKLILTEDGSHSIFLPDLNESYHSKYGAVQESMHVFIKHGLQIILPQKKQINVLEIGMGTALNVLLTYCEVNNTKVVRYDTFEPFPIKEKIWKKLNYPEQINCKNAKDIFEKIHESEWNKEIKISDKFILQKMYSGIQETEIVNDYDLIYFDAFCPDVQEELWSEAIFEKIYYSMKKNGILMTYSAKGKVKRTLKSVGFCIEPLPGPVGKREITRAIKN